jgi:hypothetical protein
MLGNEVAEIHAIELIAGENEHQVMCVGARLQGKICAAATLWPQRVW